MRRIALAILMIAFALMPFAASAQTSVTGSGFQVQNLDEANAAAIQITYYNSNGTVNATQDQTIPAGGALTFFDGNGGTVAMSATAGFRGSVVISSDRPIAAITNLIGTGIGGSYGGFSSGSQTVSVPLIVRNNFGSTTVLTVQNTGSAATNVTVSYNPGVAGTATTETATIAPGAAATFSQGDNAALGERFVGSATVTADAGGSIVAIVDQEGNSKLLTYNGFTSSAQSIAVPLLVGNNFGNLTGLQIQNSGTASAAVTVTFTPNTVTTAPGTQTVCATPPAKNLTIPAGASQTLIQAGGSASEGFDDFFATCRYVGGATVSTTTAGASLSAIVNQVGGANGSSYESFSTAAATGTVKVPLAAANNFGNLTGIQIQNVGGASTDITVVYGPNTVTGADACGTPVARTKTVAAGASVTLIQAGGAESDGFDSQFATCRYVGSATVTSTAGSKIVGIVNQAGSAGGDSLFTYNAFNQ